jgi:L-rhamnono-1,4-lactonase
MYRLASFSSTYMKLSGAFSELTPRAGPWQVPEVVAQIGPWVDVIFDAFGPYKIMFGSDWPVCNTGGGGNNNAWTTWSSVVEDIIRSRQLSEEETSAIWGNTALKAYRIIT